MRVMITGGGTGGHTSPAQAIVEELRRRDPQLLVQWVGRGGAIEERVCRANGIPFRSLPVEGWPRSARWRKPWVLAKLGVSLLRAFVYLRRFQPQAVIAVGGYASLPLALAAQRMKIPTLLHEQNKRLGLANRMLAPRADRLFLSYADTVGDFDAERARVVGNPVRSGFAHPPEQAAARETMALEADVPVLFVVGGSQGAQSINRAVAAMLNDFEAGQLQVLWMTGKTGHEEACAVAEQAECDVRVYAFVDDMVTACAAADLVVSRAGASSTAELAVLGKPAILIPYPHAAENHQEQNARALEEAGSALVLLDGDCDGPQLGALVRELLGDQARLNAMAEAAAALAKPAAAEAIVEEAMLLVFGPD